MTASTAAQIGQLLGAQLILTGSITQFSIERISGGFRSFGASCSQAESRLDVRIVDTTTGEIILAEEGEGKKPFGGGFFKGAGIEWQFDAGVAQESLRPVVEDIVEKITSQGDRFTGLEAVRPSGQVVGISDGGVYINRCENFNVQTGERFDGYRVVDEIKDADGTVLDRITDKVGVVEVTRVLSQSAVCRIVEGEVAEGDSIRGSQDPRPSSSVAGLALSEAILTFGASEPAFSAADPSPTPLRPRRLEVGPRPPRVWTEAATGGSGRPFSGLVDFEHPPLQLGAIE